MGMDIHGYRDTYFRASVPQWHAILQVMRLSDYSVPQTWDVNEGHGLETQAACDELAQYLAAFVKARPCQGDIFPADPASLPRNPLLLLEPPAPGTPASRGVTKAQLEELIGFLRTCGGFEIW